MLRPGFFIILSTIMLSACTTLAEMPPGTPVSALKQKFGPASIVCPQDDLTSRFVWSTQPMGQYAWAAEVDSKQQLKQVSQVLNDEEFNLLGQGTWHEEQVLCHFGPPADKDITPYKGVKMRVWSYRYKQNGAWDSMMYVYFDEKGVVKHYHPGPDPLKERDIHFMLRL